jgi:hypothetical protein
MSIDINYKLEELKVAELSVHQLIAEDPNLNHGIYVFKNQSDGIYVGRSTSGSFVEGISAHFDKKNNAWMNTILKKLSNSKGILIQEAYSYFLNSFELVLIPFNTNLIEKTRINAIAKEWINSIGTLNKKTDYEKTFILIISNYISIISTKFC